MKMISTTTLEGTVKLINPMQVQIVSVNNSDQTLISFGPTGEDRIVVSESVGYIAKLWSEAMDVSGPSRRGMGLL